MKTTKDVLGKITSGQIISGLMYRNGVSSGQLSNAVEIERDIIIGLCENKIPMTKHYSEKLGKYFNITPEVFFGETE